MDGTPSRRPSPCMETNTSLKLILADRFIGISSGVRLKAQKDANVPWKQWKSTGSPSDWSPPHLVAHSLKKQPILTRFHFVFSGLRLKKCPFWVIHPKKAAVTPCYRISFSYTLDAEGLLIWTKNEWKCHCWGTYFSSCQTLAVGDQYNSGGNHRSRLKKAP